LIFFKNAIQCNIIQPFMIIFFNKVYIMHDNQNNQIERLGQEMVAAEEALTAAEARETDASAEAADVGRAAQVGAGVNQAYARGLAAAARAATRERQIAFRALEAARDAARAAGIADVPEAAPGPGPRPEVRRLEEVNVEEGAGAGAVLGLNN
jgi:hypothetical protein